MEITQSETAPPAPKLFSELRAWMDRTNTTQATLAQFLGIREPQMSRMLNGTRALGSDYATRLSDLTGIPVEKLLTDRSAIRLLKFLGKRSRVSTKKTKGKRSVA